MSNTESNEEWVDINEASAYLKVSIDTIRSWIRKNPNFPAYRAGRLWRFKKSDLDKWVKGEETHEKED